MVIHLLSSYKGGTGKTTMAVCMAYHALQNNKRVVLIDTNSQNSNLADDLFFHFHVDKSRKSRSSIVSDEYNIYTTAPDSNKPFVVYDARDQNPFIIAKRIQKTDNTDTVFIIDTNVHIRSSPHGEEYTGHHNLFVWFLWGWSNPRLYSQMNSILSATKRIESTWPSAQVIHVFNLYDFYASSGLSIRKSSNTVKPLKKVLNEIDKRIYELNENENVCKPAYIGHRTIRDFGESLHDKLIRYVLPDDMNIEELPELWSEELMNLITSAEGLPYNILLIPTFFKEMIMSVDRIVMAAPRRFDVLIDQVRPMYMFIKTFMQALNVCYDTGIEKLP